VTGPCEHDNESSGSIKDKGYFDWLSDYQLHFVGSVKYIRPRLDKKKDHSPMYPYAEQMCIRITPVHDLE
jgi:hypothetical protein